MRKRISRQSFPPPMRGRRMPVAKAKGEDRPNARDLLATVNSASSGASTSWIAFLGTMAYLAVTLGGVTHVELLLNEPTTLPFVNVKVPLATFFVMAPLAFVLVHFGLLLQHVMLSRKLCAFEARLHKEQPASDRRDQNIRDELHSCSFTQAASGKPKGTVVDIALGLMMSLTLVVLPLSLLVFFQIGFLPYHSDPITWWHRIMLLVDATMIVALAPHIARRDREGKVSLTDWWHARSETKAKLIVWWHRKFRRALIALSGLSLHVRGKDYGPIIARATGPVLKGVRNGCTFTLSSVSPNRIVIGVLMLFSLCVATLPSDPLDKATVWVAQNWLPSLSEPLPYCRDILDNSEQAPTGASKVGDKGSAQESDAKPAVAKQGKEVKYKKKCPQATSATPRAFYLTALLFEHEVDETSGKSDSLLGWSRNLIVTDKDLAVADDDKKEKRLNLRGRDLRYATLDRSKLRHADFYGARLAGASLAQIDLYTVNFRTANLQGANLTLANLQGADLTWASLQGAALRWASLQGADLRWASLQGADLGEAKLEGAKLAMASLQAADLSEASLQGADLYMAKLQGANLDGAKLQTAYLHNASLEGAKLTQARLQGAYLSRANLQGTDFSLAKLQGADFYRTKLWKSRTPGGKGMPIDGDAWDLVSFARMEIRPLNDDERTALGKTIAELEVLQTNMAKEGASGRGRVAKALKNVKTIATQVGPLEEAREVEEGVRTWCELAHRPAPDGARLSTYLGTLACTDDTDKAYVAQRLIDRFLPETHGYYAADPAASPLDPNAFLEAFKGCPAFGRIPPDIRSLFVHAAAEDKEKEANRKKVNADKMERPTQPTVSKICTSLVDKPATPGANDPPPNPPSSAPR